MCSGLLSTIMIYLYIFDCDCASWTFNRIRNGFGFTVAHISYQYFIKIYSTIVYAVLNLYIYICAPPFFFAFYATLRTLSVFCRPWESRKSGNVCGVVDQEGFYCIKPDIQQLRPPDNTTAAAIQQGHRIPSMSSSTYLNGLARS